MEYNIDEILMAILDFLILFAGLLPENPSQLNVSNQVTAQPALFKIKHCPACTHNACLPPTHSYCTPPQCCMQSPHTSSWH